MKHTLLAVPLVLLACSVTRPMSLPAPVAGAQPATVYPALLVTDSAGHRRWVYAARVEGDTLRGLRGPEPSRERLALPLSQVRAVAAPRFSAVRTAGLVGGLVGVAVVAALLAPDPVYVIEYR